MIEKLGDNKQPVRDAAMTSIEGIMSVAGAGEVFERMLACFGHKTWRLREQVAVCVQRTLSGPQARAVPLADVVPLVAKLLNDQQPAVRTAAMEALVEVYRIVGDKLKRDLEKHKIRPAQMKQLSDRFDEIGGASVADEDEDGGDPAFSAAPVPRQRSAGAATGSGSVRASLCEALRAVGGRC